MDVWLEPFLFLCLVYSVCLSPPATRHDCDIVYWAVKPHLKETNTGGKIFLFLKTTNRFEWLGMGSATIFERRSMLDRKCGSLNLSSSFLEINTCRQFQIPYERVYGEYDFMISYMKGISV